MKKNKLYTVNKYNKHGFMFQGLNDKPENLYGFGSAFMKASGLGNLKSMFSAEGIGNSLGQFVGNMFGTSTYEGVSANPETESTTEEPVEKAFGGPVYRTPKGNLHFLGGITGGLASAVGGAIGGAISNGYSSTAGSVVDKVGDLVGNIPGFGTIAGAGLKVLSGGINALFGTKVDQAKLKAANAGTAAYNKFTSNAKNFDAIKTATAQANVQNAYSGGLFNRGAAARKNEELKKARAEARSWADRSVGNNIANLVSDQNNNALANFSAFGGPIGIDPSTAIGYSLYTDKYIKDMHKDSSGISNLFAGTPDIFGFGGGIYSNGAAFNNGVSYINSGGTHEENPYDGVQMGTDGEGVPNLVEEGEVVWNDYVFSNRLIVPRGKRGNYGKRARKYAEGGELSKGSKVDVPYESKVLRPYEGYTFADAAKKIIKKNGADEVNDPITLRGIDAELSVLASVQEKERQVYQLREMEEAIDNMSPEEFAMLQQQMESQQIAQQQQEEALRQQQMIPQGMEQMQPIEQQQPIAALGGLLNTPDNMYPYGGDLKKFREDLKKANVSEEDYLRAFYNMRYDKLYEEAQDKDNLKSKEEFVAEQLEKFKQSPEEVLNDENFNKDFAETFLNRVETLTKQYNRRAKKQGIKVDNLQGATKAQYNRDLNQAIQKGLTDADYDVAQDTELTFNNSNVSKAKDKQEAYNNAAAYNDLIARGGRAVELDDQGRPTWESITGLNKIDNSAEGFYDNLGDLNETALGARGVYDYNNAQKSSIDVDDYKNVKLRGWNKNEDGTYAVSSEYDNPNQTSLNPGNSDTTYPIADIGDLKPGSEEYDAALKAIQDNADYKRQTDYVKKALEAANGDVDKLNPDVYNYIKYLDENSGNQKGKLLNEDGSLSKTAVKDYTRRREDSQYGIYHYQFDDAKNATANRYYYKDKDKDGKDINVYISKPEGTDFTISENPTVVTGTDGTQFNDYEVTGLNKNRTLTQLPTGEVVDVTNINDKDSWKKLDKPVLADNTDNLGYGIKGTTDWVDYGSSPAGKGIVTENDPFPKAPSWPYLAGIGLQAGSLAYNLLSPKDYSNADAMIKAAQNAGNYNPIEFRPIGNYLTYRPMDIWFEQNRMDANARATDRAIMNNAAPISTKMAGLLASGYNNQIADGDLYRKALEYNDALRKQVEEFNKDTDKFNSEGFLKADMSNQDAATRSRGYTLEGLKSGYAMRQAVDDAKTNAINAGLSGLANLAFAYGQNKYNQELLGWGMRHNAEGPGVYMQGSKRKTEAKGGRVRRKKGIGF